jgi:hypothetical protein
LFLRVFASSWLLLVVASCGPATDRTESASTDRSSILLAGPATDFWKPTAIGDPPAAREQPQVANVAIADLDQDGLPDVLVCDAGRRRLSWIRESPKGVYAEQVLAEIRAPGHVEPIDHDGDGDGDQDLAVATFGYDQRRRCGSRTAATSRSSGTEELRNVFQLLSSSVPQFLSS